MVCLDSIAWENAKQYKHNKTSDTWDTKQIQIKLDPAVSAYGEQRNVYRYVTEQKCRKQIKKIKRGKKRERRKKGRGGK